MQLTYYNSQFKKQLFPIVLICENVTNAANVGSIFRTADAFGVEKIIFCGSPIPTGRKMLKTSRSTEKYVAHEFFNDVLSAIENYKAENYHIVALEIAHDSQSIAEWNIKGNQKYAVIVGDENFGISEAVLKTCDTTIHIEMFGHNSSMNVVQATTIALYELTKQLMVLK